MLVEYNSLPYNYQPKIEYDTLIQNVILKERNNGCYKSRFRYRIKNEN